MVPRSSRGRLRPFDANIGIWLSSTVPFLIRLVWGWKRHSYCPFETYLHTAVCGYWTLWLMRTRLRARIPCYLLGHFKLWKLGFQHSNPSLANLMVDPVTKHVVLNDWDLSRHPDFPNSVQPHRERTGTAPFKVVDLLSPSNWKGKQACLYRHDLEGLIWMCSSCMMIRHSSNKA